MNRSWATSVLVGAVVLAGCGGDDTPAATTDLEMTGLDELAFEPEHVAVPVGEEVSLEFTSEPSVEHDIVIEDAGEVAMVGEEGHGEDEEAEAAEEGEEGDEHMEDEGNDAHVVHAGAGETVTATFMVEEAGDYTLYCTVPGHREAGMEATLSVVDDA